MDAIICDHCGVIVSADTKKRQFVNVSITANNNKEFYHLCVSCRERLFNGAQRPHVPIEGEVVKTDQGSSGEQHDES